MTVRIEMSAEEFQEFMAWKKAKECYDEELQKIDRQIGWVIKKIYLAVEPDKKRKGKYKIADQEHADELFDMCKDLAEKLEG